MTNEYPSDWTPLHVAVWRHEFRRVESLASTIDLNKQDEYGWTPLHLACAAKDSEIFSMKQVNPRKLRSAPSRGGCCEYDEARERFTSWSIARTLLSHGANVHSQTQGRHSPLHCAASSGWLDHVRALVEKGAHVYTGPTRSPLCWVKGGSSGSHPVALFLREQLGPPGRATIQEDHEQEPMIRGAELPPVDSPASSFNEWERPPISLSPDRPTYLPPQVYTDGLCSKCTGMSLKDLLHPGGYRHSSSSSLAESAGRCKLCSYICLALGKKPEPDQDNEVWITINLSNKKHPSSDSPPIIRALDIRISPGCSCPGTPLLCRTNSSADFTACRGMCARILMQIAVFSDIGIEITADPLSSRSLGVIRRWLRTCESHEFCKPTDLHSICISGSGREHGRLPTRIIEVDFSSDQILIVPGAERFGRYAALSHRWVTGPMPSWVTKQKTVEGRECWFSRSCLSASIVDAVKLVQALEMKYLWIDSLCIIQDSAADWVIESSRMTSVFANAYLTIFAGCARDDDSGFLLPRAPLPILSLPIQMEDGQTMMLHLRKHDPDNYWSGQDWLFESHVEKSCLSDRGWIFQERMLSRRILHFSKNQIFWECKERILAEDGHDIDLGFRHADYQDSKHFFYTWPYYEYVLRYAYWDVLRERDLVPSNTFLGHWNRLVSCYSRLKLTRSEDKLPALSGLASAFGRRAGDNRYVAGLWGNDLAGGLTWEVKSGHVQDRPSAYRAPSFSWASIDGDINFRVPDPEVSPEVTDGELTLEVKAIDLELETTDPYGRVKSCSVLMSGFVARGFCTGPEREKLESLEKGDPQLYDDEMAPVGVLQPDSTEDAGTCGPVLFLQTHGSSTRYPRVVFVRTMAEDEDFPSYRRMGLLWLKDPTVDPSKWLQEAFSRETIILQ